MRYIAAAILALYALSPLTGYGEIIEVQDVSTPPNQLATNRLPDALSQSINAYTRGGSGSAITVLTNATPIVSNKKNFAATMRSEFSVAEKLFGILLKVEPIFVRHISVSYRQYYVLYGYRDGVLFARYDFYRSDNDDYLVDCAFSRDPDKILPPLSENVEY
ncbi:hypothetical protein [Ruficoccus sp. ZRK36]|uniref:hypothetical protein n=1 Tax=Ruficoccus sp. ZRK36 TaxID=2866311 RepID=UPI001C72E20F|nr:hypothetical protein [Ruficoccus sp. ZRK36]QYY37163.1 hypothetical protein K0V07_06685 [Ruficoccus sp. ZRK36]